MVLGFKPQFVAPILDGSKIHTIREDKNKRWKPGNKIHFATGVRTKNYKQFKEITPCISVQRILIFWFGTTVKIVIDGKLKVNFNTATAYIDYDNNGYSFLENLSFKDGFYSIDAFLKWFSKDYIGRIIHWTGLKY